MNGMTCPKCGGSMRTYDRNGVHLEQCDRCRGIFLDYGELEALTRIEAQWTQQPGPYGPGPVPPAWGTPQHGHHGKQRHRGIGRMLFSS
jgi:uncharacterized protein